MATKKEAFAQAEEEYRQARANSYQAWKEYLEAKKFYIETTEYENKARMKYFAFVKPSNEALKYLEELDEIGLK